MDSVTKFATETAKLLKQFTIMSKDNESAKAEFCNELSDSSEEQQENLILLFEMAKEEISKLRRSEKSSSKGATKAHGDDIAKKVKATKKDQIVELLMSGEAVSKKHIQSLFACDRKTVDRAIKEIEKKGKVVTTTENNELQVAVNA